jgi:hypothetical protein
MSTVLKRHLRGILLQAKGDCCDRVNSDQTIILGTDRREAGPQERRPKAFQTKLTQGGASDSDQMVLVMVRQEAGPRKRQPKALKGEWKTTLEIQRT